MKPRGILPYGKRQPKWPENRASVAVSAAALIRRKATPKDFWDFIKGIVFLKERKCE